MADETSTTEQAEEAEEQPGQKQERRKIPGNMPYTSSAGVLKKVLERIPDAEKPSVFSNDFLSAVFQVSGGSARPIPPILKTMGMLAQNGAPTELYSQFQTQSGRANAALQLLRNGFSEVFKRNQYANRLGEKDILDIVVSITGLPRSDKVVKSIVNTYQVFQGFAAGAKEEALQEETEIKAPDRIQKPSETADLMTKAAAIGLTYNINVVLPETTNVEVYNAIFKSIRANLLQ